MNLKRNHYGKKDVRLLRVRRDDGGHSVAEWSVDVLVEGDFDGAYLSTDNSSVVPTDTIKNTILALAHDDTGLNRDAFAVRLAEHFTTRYPGLRAAEVEVRENRWRRAAPDGKPHPHVFIAGRNGLPFGFARAENGSVVRCGGGLRDWTLMKTTGSGFAGYPVCEMTTLAETHDRILATSLSAQWEVSETAEPLAGTLREEALRVFANNFSPSVQRTLYEIGSAFLARVPRVARVRLTMPNIHYLPLDLTPLGLPEGQKEVFLPSDAPHGFIEAEVER